MKLKKRPVALIVGTGVIGAYLSSFLLKKRYKIITTSRKLKKNYINYSKLKIEKKIIFKKLGLDNKKEIKKIIKKENPNFIFYFAGISSIPLSFKKPKETLKSNYLGAKKFLEVLKETKSPIKFFKANSGYIFDGSKSKITAKSKFIKYSQQLAENLAESHFRTKIPGGYCLIGQGKTKKGNDFFFTVKAELQEVFTITGDNLELIKNVFLSPAKDFYKVAFFIRVSSLFIPFMYDDQFSMQKRDLTEYFYGQFLGLTTDKNDSLRSKNFFDDTKSFIESNVKNVKDRMGLLKALRVLYREETSGLISGKDFSDKYLEGKLKTKFEKIISEKYPHAFTRNISLIDNKIDLERISIPLSYSLALVGNADDIGDVEIIDHPDGEDYENIGHEFNNGSLRKVVLLKEAK